MPIVKKHPPQDNQAIDPVILDQAIQWLVRLRFDTPGSDVNQAFQQWLARGPQQALAWQRVEPLGSDFARLPPALARQTLDGAKRQLNRREGLKLLGLFIAAGGVAWAARDHTPLPGLLADHRSATGERRRVELEDGSQIQLNSDSAFDVDFDPARRLVALKRGEIIVETGGDGQASSPRPFWVRSRDGYLRALGTRFLVREHPAGGTLLAVREGAVAIFPDGPSQAPVRVVQAGEQTLFSPRGVSTMAANGLDPWAWSDGVISAQAMRLGDFIAELSRHRSGRLRCSDEVADLRISGTFQLDDIDQVLALVARTLPVQVEQRNHYWVTITARG